jgi:glycine cleavage system H protein
MSEIPSSLRYSEEHEYIRESEDEGVVSIGITDFAQGELGDVVYVELPQPGDRYARMDSFGTIEAVKAVSELYSPIAGEIVEINEALEDDPALVNTDPYGEGWMVRLRVDDATQLDELLSADDYRKLVGEEEA